MGLLKGLAVEYYSPLALRQFADRFGEHSDLPLKLVKADQMGFFAAILVKARMKLRVRL